MHLAGATSKSVIDKALAALNPPLTANDFDPQKYLAMYPDVAAKPKYAKNPYQHYIDVGYAAGRTFTLKETAIARQLQSQFAYADYIAAQALKAAGVTGADFDVEAFTTAHKGDPAWYASWSPWQFYIYYGLAMGYVFPVKGAGSTSASGDLSTIPTSIPSGWTPSAIAPLALNPNFDVNSHPYGIQTVLSGLYPWMDYLITVRPDLKNRQIGFVDAVYTDLYFKGSGGATSATNGVQVISGLTPWMTWLVSQYPSMQGQVITSAQATAYANQYAALPISSSAVLPYTPTNYTDSYSPYQTNYAVAPGIPDTGLPGIPGTGTGAPSGPLTYDQITAATDAATASPLQANLGWIGLGVFGVYYFMKHKKAKRSTAHHASSHH